MANDVDVPIRDARFASTDPTTAGAGRVLFFHHHPDRDDAGIDQVIAAHQVENLIVEAAREGAEYNLNGSVDTI